MADQETCLQIGRCLLFLSVIAVCKCFNLDPKFSVVKTGVLDTYFGYSVTEHQIVADDKITITENLLLVGAPRAKKQIGGIPVGGAIFKCNASSTVENDCQQLTTPPFSNQPEANTQTDDQWMGVVLQSYGKGQRIITCAHRYIKENSALGVCHTLDQDLAHHDMWIPCQGKPHNNYLEDFGLCQAGFSAVIGQEDAMAIGAPGSVYWKGVVFQHNISDVLGSNKVYNTPVEGSPTDKYSYLGYAVAFGKFDMTRQLYLAAGAPRENEQGVVVLFRREQNDLGYDKKHILNGTMDFSGFGSSLLSLDLNKDGFDDLIIGAPYYYQKGKGGAIYIYYGGNMITSTSQPTIISSREMTDAECIELSCEHARFGLSLAKLGDINNDKYEDFAVGAPYEGNGAVYIYHGSKDGVVKTYAQRISAKDLPSYQMKSFGVSLSGGLDLDSNGYPDLLVGSYESAHVALIRSRAIIKLSANITVNPDMIDLAANPFCQYDNTPHHCVQLSVCVKFSAEPVQSFRGRPQINYRVEVERTRSFSRLEMVRSLDAAKKFVEGTITLYEQASGRPACIQELAYLKEVFSDKLLPMELTVKFSQNELPYTRPRPGQPLPDINSYPILSTQGAERTEPNMLSVMVDFVKDCGDDNTCKSNLQFVAGLLMDLKDNVYVLKVGEKSSVLLNITVVNWEEAAYETRVYIQTPDKMDYQGVTGEGQDSPVKCSALEEDKTLIVCDDIGNPLKKGKLVSFVLKISSNRLLPTEDSLNITTWVNTSSTEMTPENDRHVLRFNVILEADLVVSANVFPDDQILCSGEPRGASAMKTEEDIGPAVNHSFVVTNKGFSDVPLSTFIIEWPYEVGGEGAHGKYLLYLMQEPIVVRGEAVCRVEDSDTINPLKIMTITPKTAPITVEDSQLLDEKSRRKRQAQDDSRSKRALDKPILGCKQKTAKCRKITCDLKNLRGGDAGYVQIIMRARLWESTLLQDYRKAGDVEIRSWGYVMLDKSLKIQQNPNNDEAEAITSAVPDFKDPGTQPVMWWIILLAVLGGMLLLAVIIVILYKVGFFKRKRPDEMQMYQAEKKQQKMLDDYEEAES